MLKYAKGSVANFKNQERRSLVDIKKKLIPGTIIFVDMNGNGRDHFGVIVDKDFWQEAVGKEDIILPWIKNHEKNIDQCHLYRVLGICQFRRWWLENDSSTLEPDPMAVIHYRFHSDYYTKPFNLRPFIKSINQLKTGEHHLLFPATYKDQYLSSALEDAEIIYQYLSGKRFQSNYEKKFLSKEEKLFRLLGLAIPNPELLSV